MPFILELIIVQPILESVSLFSKLGEFIRIVNSLLPKEECSGAEDIMDNKEEENSIDNHTW